MQQTSFIFFYSHLRETSLRRGEVSRCDALNEISNETVQ